MKNLFNSPFKGIVEDFKSRKACYNQDWSNALCSGPRYKRYVHDHFNNLNFFSFICFFFSPYKYWFWLFRYLNVHVRILAPTTYMFFASALPVIAFGEQLSKETGSYVLQSIYLCVTSLLVTHTHTHNLPNDLDFSLQMEAWAPLTRWLLLLYVVSYTRCLVASLCWS